MDPRVGDKYVPLPKKLPPKSERSSSSEDSKEGKGKRRKAMVIQAPHLQDPEAYPIIESPSSPSPRRRDSGVFSIEGSPRRYYYDSRGQLTYPPQNPTPSNQNIQELSDRFNDILSKKEHDRIEAQQDAIRARQEANDAKAELERVKRQSWLDDRERNVSDRERQHREEQKRISDAPKRDVVVVQPSPPARYDDTPTDALKRAKDDYKRKSGRY